MAEKQEEKATKGNPQPPPIELVCPDCGQVMSADPMTLYRSSGVQPKVTCVRCGAAHRYGRFARPGHDLVAAVKAEERKRRRTVDKGHIVLGHPPPPGGWRYDDGRSAIQAGNLCLLLTIFSMLGAIADQSAWAFLAAGILAVVGMVLRLLGRMLMAVERMADAAERTEESRKGRDTAPPGH